MLFIEVDNEKVGVDNEKALELTNSTVFQKRVDIENAFIFQSNFHIEIIEISPKNATKYPVVYMA